MQSCFARVVPVVDMCGVGVHPLLQLRFGHVVKYQHLIVRRHPSVELPSRLWLFDEGVCDGVLRKKDNVSRFHFTSLPFGKICFNLKKVFFLLLPFAISFQATNDCLILRSYTYQ